MAKHKPPAERTGKGTVRFRLDYTTQEALKRLVQHIANTPAPMTLKTLPLIAHAHTRAKAQELLTKRAFLLMPLVLELPFTLPESDALALLMMMWGCDISSSPALTYFFGCLHQTLS